MSGKDELSQSEMVEASEAPAPDPIDSSGLLPAEQVEVTSSSAPELAALGLSGLDPTDPASALEDVRIFLDESDGADGDSEDGPEASAEVRRDDAPDRRTGRDDGDSAAGDGSEDLDRKSDR